MLQMLLLMRFVLQMISELIGLIQKSCSAFNQDPAEFNNNHSGVQERPLQLGRWVIIQKVDKELTKLKNLVANNCMS